MNAKAAPPIKAEPKPAVPITRGDDLAERLADDISSSVFAPGSRLDEVRLAARYGTSRTPVREALRQLEAVGLIERRPYRGAIVSAPTPQRLAEMLAAASEIEASCARLAALAMSAAERAALRKAHDAMGDLARKGTASGREAIAEANATFHEHLYAGTHNATLAGYARDLRRRLKPFGHERFRGDGRAEHMVAAHAAIVRAIEAGNADEAERLTREHMGAVETSATETPKPERS